MVTKQIANDFVASSKAYRTLLSEVESIIESGQTRIPQELVEEIEREEIWYFSLRDRIIKSPKDF